MPRFHVLMPFSRSEHIHALREMLRPMNVIWHPIIHESLHFGDEPWIRPHRVIVRPDWDPCYFKLNTFENIEDDDYYHFGCDDNYLPPDYFTHMRHRLHEWQTTIPLPSAIPLFVTRCHMPGRVLEPCAANMRVDSINLSQMTVQGRVLREIVFYNAPVADGLAAHTIEATYKERIHYVPESCMYYNYFNSKYWLDPHDPLRPDYVR